MASGGRDATRVAALPRSAVRHLAANQQQAAAAGATRRRQAQNEQDHRKACSRLVCV